MISRYIPIVLAALVILMMSVCVCACSNASYASNASESSNETYTSDLSANSITLGKWTISVNDGGQLAMANGKTMYVLTSDGNFTYSTDGNNTSKAIIKSGDPISITVDAGNIGGAAVGSTLGAGCFASCADNRIAASFNNEAARGFFNINKRG